MADVKTMIEEIAKAIVEKPDAVEVRESKGEQGGVLELKVDPADLGKVIGKQGRTARSMRTLLNSVGMKTNRRYGLDILE
jgi:predicted RNA-binding protein YlqC (UPF0109 family)